MDPPTNSTGPSMDAYDIERLSFIGELIHLGIKQVIGEIAMYGPFVLLTGLAIYCVLTRSRKSLGAYALFSALLLLFLIITLHVAMDIALLTAQVEKLLIQNSEFPFQQRVYIYNFMSWFFPVQCMQAIIAGSADCGLVFLMTDALAAWRASSLWQTTSRVSRCRLFLHFLLFCTAALWIPATVLHIRSINVGTFSKDDPVAILQQTVSALSIMTNAVAAGMIGLTAYRHRAFSSGGHLKGPKILAFLAESAVFYLLIQLTRLILARVPQADPMATGYNVFERTTVVVSAMYIPGLVLIVNYGYSIADSVQIPGTEFTTTAGDSDDPSKERRVLTPKRGPGKPGFGFGKQRHEMSTILFANGSGEGEEKGCDGNGNVAERSSTARKSMSLRGLEVDTVESDGRQQPHLWRQSGDLNEERAIGPGMNASAV